MPQKKLTEKEQEHLKRLKNELSKWQRLIEEHKAKRRIELFKPYSYQQKVFDLFRMGKNIVIMPLSNKVGKTVTGACLVHSWAIGYEPWSPVRPDYEGAVKIGNYYYRPSSLGIKPPVDIRVTGEDWEEHIKKTVVKELKYWGCMDEWELQKNNVGVEATWIHKPTGSTINMMTYKQEPDVFEAFAGHGWWGDEPPPKHIWTAMSRALFIRGGKVFLSMTPLKEAWIFDELMTSDRPDVGVVKGVSLWDCPHLYDADIETLKMAGLTEEQAIKWLTLQKEEALKTKNLRESEAVLKEWLGSKEAYFKDDFGATRTMDAFLFAIQRLKIHRFIKDLQDDEERLARVFGEPKYLIGRVWKAFNRDIHVVKTFNVPPDWPVTFQIDFHINKPHAIAFFTVNPHGQRFQCGEIWANLTAEEIADCIVREKQRNCWRLNYGEIDPLAKGDTAYVRNRLGNVEDSFRVIERKLQKFGIRLGIGSKDEASYIKTVSGWLEGSNNGLPLFYIMDCCQESIRQVERWVYNEYGKPSDDGHFPECIGRFSQMGLKYTDPSVWSKALNTGALPLTAK